MISFFIFIAAKVSEKNLFTQYLKQLQDLATQNWLLMRERAMSLWKTLILAILDPFFLDRTSLSNKTGWFKYSYT